MALQGVNNVYDLQWRPVCRTARFGCRDEVEQSRYAFGQVEMPRGSSAEFHRDMFNRCYDFPKPCSPRIRAAALDYCLKCSHFFNVLDASGSIGVTSAPPTFLRVRQLAVAIAQAWQGGPRPPRQRTNHGIVNCCSRSAFEEMRPRGAGAHHATGRRLTARLSRKPRSKDQRGSVRDAGGGWPRAMQLTGGSPGGSRPNDHGAARIRVVRTPKDIRRMAGLGFAESSAWT